MELKIRKAVLDDANKISHIWNVICSEKKYTAVDKPFSPQQEEDYLKSLSEREVVFIAEMDNTIIGFQSLDLWSNTVGSFSHVGTIGTFFLPEWRSQGFSYIIANYTLDFARLNNYEKIVIFVRKGNERAIKFYQNLGFLIKGELRNQVKIDGIYEDEIFMEKFL